MSNVNLQKGEHGEREKICGEAESSGMEIIRVDSPGTGAELTLDNNFGVGIYIGPDKVMSSVIKAEDKLSEFCTRPQTLTLSPFIAFIDEKICYGEEAQEVTRSNSNYKCINIYEILTPKDTSNLCTAVEIHGETFQLRPEAILAFFLHHIKLELEYKCELDSPIDSCVVAVSAFLPEAGRKILKTALFLAGFSFDGSTSVLIHTTTAMGISFQLRNSDPKAETTVKEVYRKNEYHLLVICEAPGIFDVASLVIFKGTPESQSLEAEGRVHLQVKAVVGLAQIPQDKKDFKFHFSRPFTDAEQLEKNIQTLVRKCMKESLKKGWTLDAVIMTKEHNYHWKTVNECVRKELQDFHLIDKNQGILVGAAVLNLHLNNESGNALDENVKRVLNYQEKDLLEVSGDDSRRCWMDEEELKKSLEVLRGVFRKQNMRMEKPLGAEQSKDISTLQKSPPPPPPPQQQQQKLQEQQQSPSSNVSMELKDIKIEPASSSSSTSTENEDEEQEQEPEETSQDTKIGTTFVNLDNNIKGNACALRLIKILKERKEIRQNESKDDVIASRNRVESSFPFPVQVSTPLGNTSAPSNFRFGFLRMVLVTILVLLVLGAVILIWNKQEDYCCRGNNFASSFLPVLKHHGPPVI